MSDAARAFWGWFAANAPRLQAYRKGPDPVLAELAGELAGVHAGLTFELGPLVEGCRDFIVSADGLRKLFPEVRALIAAAPAIPGWRIVAFRQRRQDPVVVRVDKLKIEGGDVWFRAERDGPRAGLFLFVRDLTEENFKVLGGAVMILLDAALGEYDTETKVGFIEWAELPGDPAAAGLRPFRELSLAVDLIAGST